MTATTNDERHRVVIIGCGFAGLFAARAFKRDPVSVTVIDRRNHHLFQPLLYQVATGILSEGQIAPAIRDVLRNHQSLRVVLANVTEIDLDVREVHADKFGTALTIPYDSLVVAGGSSPSYYGHDEFQQFAHGLKSLDDAMELRGRIFGAFELAEAEEDEMVRRALMTFVVVGGGPTGVEMAGQLRELSHRALHRNYRRIDPHDTRVVLVEGTDRLLGSMGERLSERTERALVRQGVEVHTGGMVTDMDASCVVITKDDGSTVRVDAVTKVWAAGTQACALSSLLCKAGGVQTDRTGRVLVESDCSLPGRPEVFVVGDLMALDNLPGVAEVAMQSGAHAASTIKRRLDGDEPKPFRYHDLGTLAVISRFRAVAKVGPFRFGGLVGWVFWLVVHITFLTGYKNRVGALVRWAISFIGRGRYERALTGRWEAGTGGGTPLESS